MKIVTLVPGPKPNTVMLPMPDPILQYLGWKEGDEVCIEIHRHGGTEVLMLKPA
jgi:hypothetical protein